MTRFFLFFMMPYVLFASSVDITDQEQTLIDHVCLSIEKAERGISSLTPEILQIEGKSSDKVRHFLNNLCTLPQTSYLEIGCYKGSTWISSLFGNRDTIEFACAIDDWSVFGKQKQTFIKNCRKYLDNKNYQLISRDAFDIDLAMIERPITIYFYDGDHSALSQELAFTYYNDVLENVFIAIVDDWNYESVREGTKSAFEKLNYQVLFEKILPARFNADIENWWNGLYVVVIRKASQ